MFVSPFSKGKKQGGKYCHVCSLFGLDTTVAEEKAKVPTGLAVLTDKYIQQRREHEAERADNARREGENRFGEVDRIADGYDKIRKWQKDESQTVELSQIAAQADAVCKVCSIFQELIHGAIPPEFKKVSEYAKLKIRRSYSEKHKNGLFFIVTGRPSYGSKIMKNTLDDIALKAVFSVPGWNPIQYPIELYYAEGEEFGTLRYISTPGSS